jgi:hypothetical protein
MSWLSGGLFSRRIEISTAGKRFVVATRWANFRVADGPGLVN